MNLRLWCQGPDGQAQVWNSYATGLPQETAQKELRAFEGLIQLIVTRCHRPLVRHDLHCACVGSDEGIFAHLVATASDGYMEDAALIATLLISAKEAENAAVLAARVGATVRMMSAQSAPSPEISQPANVIRLH
ncbi:hypothetical protein [Puniceibacterium sediminis]|nr:hypothetical protein [Puniceibacterium sediminis]